MQVTQKARNRWSNCIVVPLEPLKMRLPNVVLVLCALTACAPKSVPARKGTAAPSPPMTILEDKQPELRVFNLQTCFSPEVEIAKPLNAETLSGFLLMIRPDLLECLVPTKNRGD